MLNPGIVAHRLGLRDSYGPWLGALNDVGTSGGGVASFTRADVASVLRCLAVRQADLDEILDALPEPGRQPELWWLLERCVAVLVGEMGRGGELSVAWPSLPATLGTVGRYFYVYVFAAAVPYVRDYHVEHGVPDAVSWATLADLGEKVAMHRRAHGLGGFEKQGWLALHFRGGIYTLGRLQFELHQVRWPADELARAGAPFGPGEPVLAVHIPATGPLSPEACDDSFAMARGFFEQRFPKPAARYAVCNSWLLDRQLGAYLSPHANILQFQRRFTLLPIWAPGDREVREYVFGDPDISLEDVVPATTLEAAIVEQWVGGGRWRTQAGWCPL